MPTQFESLTETESLAPSDAERPRTDAETGIAIAPPRSTPFAQIDAAEVARHFQRTVPLEGDERYGIDHPVLRVPVTDRIRVETPPCPVCECETATPLFMLTHSRFRLVQCHDCGLGSLHPRPALAEIDEFYPPSYYGAAGAKFRPAIERAVRWAARRRTKWLQQGLPKRGRVLDVGCGRGTILNEMARDGYLAHGFEVSEEAAEGLHPAVKLAVGLQLADADYPDEHFDLVTAWHVLEHVADPRETLIEMRRILQPYGRVAIAVPNFGSLQARLFGPAWFHLDLPRHLFHFSAATLRTLLTDCGFEVEHERHFSLRQNPYGWVQSALNALWPESRNALYSDLKHGEANGVDGWRRFAMRAAYWTGMPLAAAASMIAAAFRAGGTICLTARPAE